MTDTPDTTYEMTATESKLLEGWCYHSPKGDQAARYGVITSATKLALAIMFKYAPPSAERTLAIRRLQEARMWCNAAIALNE